MIHLILMAAVKKKKIVRHRLVLQNVVLDGGRGDRIKKKRFLSLCPKIRFPESFCASGTNICWSVPNFIFAPYLVVVGFYESRYHAYVQMNDLAGHNYAVIIDYRSLSATVH